MKLESISKLYTKVLEDAFQLPDKASKGYQQYSSALAFIVASDKSLSIKVLETIFNIQDEDGDKIKLTLTFEKLQPFLLISNNKVEDSTIPAVHKSFIEYITDRSQCQNDAYYMDKNESNCILAEAYLKYLSQNLPRDLETF